MSLLYALTGCFDAPGRQRPASGDRRGADHRRGSAGRTGRWRPRSASPSARSAPRAGTAYRRPDFYRAMLEGTPYPVRGLIGFGANMLLAQADRHRGRAALAALDFYAHADLFMTPTAALADIVLPIASCFEREALKIGFEISAEAQSLVQLRQAVVPPPGEARSDTDVVFELADRLGLRRAVLERRHRRGVSRSARAERRHAGAAARRTGRAACPAADPPRQARRARRAGKSARLRHAVAQGRALVGDVPRSRLRAAAGLRRAADRPGDAPRSRGALSPGPDLREADAVLPDPASRAAEPAQARAGSGGGAASRGGGRARHRGRRLGLGRDAGRRHAGARAAQRPARSARGGRRARLVAGLRRRWERAATIRSATTAPTSTGPSMPRSAIPISGTPAHRANLCEVRPSAPAASGLPTSCASVDLSRRTFGSRRR